ncbi:hypothetical protein [Acinetobacter ursingii]|uniref:hypothetical protein n=1 Tax=Acinetobacter ursingii TaxID=108980 RepID=UPI0040346A5D
MTMKPLGDTNRIIEWDELPPKVKMIPEGFDPMAQGVLMQHQVDWLKLDAIFKVAGKGRRTGITFAEALDDTLLAASSRQAKGDNVYYVGDKKEKGLEFIGYCAKFARVIAKAQKFAISNIEEFIFKDVDDNGNSRDITSYRIRFSSGFQIAALSSRPANIRGLQGKVVIDEAAFHQDVDGVLDAVTALTIWGGKIAVISSHNGRKNAFNRLINDIENGKYGDDAKTITITFDDAVANGLYERVCLMNDEEATPEGKEKWYKRIRNLYGPRKAAMHEELDCIPRDGQGSRIPGIWIDEAMPEERPILRLILDSEFNAKPIELRKLEIEDWIKYNVDPVLNTLNKNLTHVAGWDFARHRDFSHVTPFEIDSALKRNAPFVLEMNNVPTKQQEQVVWHIFEGLPNFGGASIDATGSGEVIAEYSADKFGSEYIHQIKLNRAWYAIWMSKFVEAFQQQMLTLPRDENLENDLSAIEDSDGIPMVAKYRRQDVKEPELFRHGDGASSGCLAWHASLNKVAAKMNILSKGTRTASRMLRGFRSGQLLRGYR